MACSQVAVGGTRGKSKESRAGTIGLHRTSVNQRSDPKAGASQRKYPWVKTSQNSHRSEHGAVSIRENPPILALYWPTGHLAPMMLPMTRSLSIVLAVHESFVHRDFHVLRSRSDTTPSTRSHDGGQLLDRGIAFPSCCVEPTHPRTIAATMQHRLFPGMQYRCFRDTNHPISRYAKSENADARNRGEEKNGNWCSSTR